MLPADSAVFAAESASHGTPNKRADLRNPALGLANPKRGHGLALLSLGLFLAVLLLARVPPLIVDLKAGAADVECLAWSLAAVPPALAALVVTFILLYRGALAALAFFVPAGAPAHLGAWETVIPQFFVHRIIEGTYRRPTGLRQLLIARLFPRTLYLTPPHLPLLGAFVLPAVLLPAALALWIATGLFPGYLLVVVLLAFGMLTAAICVSHGSVPIVQVSLNRDRLTEAGNPADLFNHVRVWLAALQEGNLPNRVLRDETPMVGARAAINHLEADILVETQPLPVAGAQRLPLNALLLDIAAVLLGGLGWVLLLFSYLRSSRKMEELWALNTSYLLTVAAGLIALWLSHRFFGMAHGLYNTFRFGSDLLWLRFRGTYSAAKISARGPLSSQRERFQSDMLVELWAAHVISECTAAAAWSDVEPVAPSLIVGEAALAAPRYLVDAVPHTRLDQRIGYLLAHLRGFRDGGDVLAGIRMAAPSLVEIVEANLQLTMQAQAARVAGAQRAVEMLAPEPPPDRLPPPVPVPQIIPPQPATVAQAMGRVICSYADCRKPNQVQAPSGHRIRFHCGHCKRLAEAIVA